MGLYDELRAFDLALRGLKAQFTGTVGELLSTAMSQAALGQDYVILSDIVLPLGNTTTQIDQLILSPYGVFVIEVKTYKGWIFGRPTDARWTQRLHSGSYTFQNPLHQNERHIDALQALSGLPRSLFHSVIVFFGEASFKSPMPPNVLIGTQYLAYVRGFRQPSPSAETLQALTTCVQAARLPPEAHRATIAARQRAATSSSAVDSTPQRCPRCGKQMRLRTARQGANAGNQFWGCSGYPGCRQTLPVSR